MTPSLHSIVLALALPLGCLVALGADAPATFKVSELSFARPEKWEWIPTQSSMRKAQLKIPGTEADPGEVVFFHFGAGNGGGTQANVERWFRQFTEARDAIKARTEEAKAGNAKVTYVFAEGTYLSGIPGTQQTPKPGFALVGAIIEDAAGHVFVRLTGPKSVVEGATADFKKMVQGAKR